MNLPEQYKDLDIEQRRTVVVNLIDQYWDKKTQWMLDHLSDQQIDFLFTYFFTESKEKRERMWSDMQKKYELVLQELEQVADRLQKLNLKFSELLAAKEDAEEFRNNNK